MSFQLQKLTKLQHFEKTVLVLVRFPDSPKSSDHLKMNGELGDLIGVGLRCPDESEDDADSFPQRVRGPVGVHTIGGQVPRNPPLVADDGRYAPLNLLFRTLYHS